MEKIIFALLTSFFITIVTTPLTIIFAKKFNLVDDPAKRPHPAHIQKRVIPRAGGLPIFMALFLTIFLFIPIDKHIIGIILASLLLLVTGLLDDLLENFSPYPRLLLQFLAAGMVVAAGVGITFVTNPLGGVLRLDEIVYPVNFFGIHNIVLIADIFAFFWIVWMMNMINWAKGVDGQLPGITLVASLILGIFSFNLFLNGDFNQYSIALLSFITAGASLGFLIFNWHPAKILPGQSASTILGLLIATLSILSGAKLAIALLILLIPSIDFFYTFIRRIATKKSPFFGDQKHLHHLLLKRGWTHQRISLFYIFSCAILGVIALNLETNSKIFIGASVGIIVLGAILWLHYLQRLKDV